MNRTVQRTIGQQVNAHEEFRLDNISAKIYKAGERVDLGRLESFGDMNDLIDKSREHDMYVVYSYRTPIGWVKMDIPDIWYVPDHFYSMSTKRHQNALLAVISS
jgi:hypothetical protein